MFVYNQASMLSMPGRELVPKNKARMSRERWKTDPHTGLTLVHLLLKETSDLKEQMNVTLCLVLNMKLRRAPHPFNKPPGYTPPPAYDYSPHNTEDSPPEVVISCQCSQSTREHLCHLMTADVPATFGYNISHFE